MPRPLLALAALAALGVTLVGCSSDDSAGAGGCTPGSTVAVGATDAIRFDAEQYEADDGCVELVYTNDGAQPHTLLIKDVPDFKLSIGDEDKGSVELEPGAYLLYCDIPGHEAAGMEAELTVT